MLLTAASLLAQTPARPLWVDVTATALGPTKYWTNKVEIADLNGDGRPDLLFANGGDYSTPGTPEPNQVFFNTGGPGLRFQDVTSQVLGNTPDLARVIKARDLNADGFVDIIVGTTYQTQSRLFLGSGQGRFSEITGTHLPAQLLSVGDLEPGDIDGDGDLDLMLADWGPGHNMTNDGGRTRLWLNDGAGTFTDDARGMPQYTNNYEFEPMDLDGDGWLDLVTMNDGEIVGGNSSDRREHVFRNDGKGRFRDVTEAWWPPAANVGEDDNMVAFLDGDGRMDVVQAQGEHPKAVDERVFLGRGLAPDTAAPSVTMVGVKEMGQRTVVHARGHDRKSPSLATEWKRVAVEWTTPAGPREVPMRWYGENLWRADWPANVDRVATYRVCATDAAGNAACGRR